VFDLQANTAGAVIRALWGQQCARLPRIAEKAHELGWSFPVPFLCECSHIHCFARVELTLEAYDELRAHRQRYLTAPRRHEVAGAFVIEQEETFAFAEKLHAGD
jgi:hypothetical protein